MEFAAHCRHEYQIDTTGSLLRSLNALEACGVVPKLHMQRRCAHVADSAQQTLSRCHVHEYHISVHWCYTPDQPRCFISPVSTSLYVAGITPRQVAMNGYLSADTRIRVIAPRTFLDGAGNRLRVTNAVSAVKIRAGHLFPAAAHARGVRQFIFKTSSAYWEHADFTIPDCGVPQHLRCW